VIARRLALALFVVLMACRGDSPRNPDEERDAAARPPRIAELLTGHDFACARMREGDVRCWGSNLQSQLGDRTQGRRNRPQPVPELDEVIDLAVGPSVACAVRRNGIVACWGRLTPGPDPILARRTLVAGLPKTRSIAIAVEGHALTQRGEVWTFALGGSPTPKKVPIADVVEIAASGGSVCARTRDGKVRCWTDAPRDCGPHAVACTPAPGRDVGLVDVVEIAMEGERLCARRKDGTVWCSHLERRCSTVEDDTAGARPRRVAELAHAKRLVGTSCASVDGDALWCWGDSPLRAPGEDTCRASPALLAGFSRAHAIAGTPVRGCVAVGDELSCWSRDPEAWGGESVVVGTTQWTRIDGLAAAPDSSEPPLAKWMTKLVERPVSGYAYVWTNAEWFAKPGGKSVGRIADFADDQRFETHTARMPVRIVAEHGELVEVSTGVGRDDHCDSSPRELVAYELRAFVRKRDLVPVLAKSYSVGYADGTGLTLSAGVVVRPTEDGIVVDRGVELPLEVRDDDIALSYAKTKTRDPGEGAGGWLADEAEVKLDGRPLANAGARLSLFYEIVARDDGPDGSLVQLAARCVTMRVLAAPTDVKHGGATGLGSIGTGSGTAGVLGGTLPRRWRVRATAPAYWPDGTKAGRTVRTITSAMAPLQLGERLCFPAAGLTLCHDAADVSES
jgi:hypothetical protein